jgi:hypothetical protein
MSTFGLETPHQSRFVTDGLVGAPPSISKTPPLLISRLASTPECPERDRLLSELASVEARCEQFIQAAVGRMLEELEHRKRIIWSEARACEDGLPILQRALGSAQSSAHKIEAELSRAYAERRAASVPLRTKYPSPEEIYRWEAGQRTAQEAVDTAYLKRNDFTAEVGGLRTQLEAEVKRFNQLGRDIANINERIAEVQALLPKK